MPRPKVYQVHKVESFLFEDLKIAFQQFNDSTIQQNFRKQQSLPQFCKSLAQLKIGCCLHTKIGCKPKKKTGWARIRHQLLLLFEVLFFDCFLVSEKSCTFAIAKNRLNGAVFAYILKKHLRCSGLANWNPVNSFVSVETLQHWMSMICTR